MRDFSLAKISVLFVEHFANSSLLPSIFASDTLILSHRKFHSDLFRGSLTITTKTALHKFSAAIYATYLKTTILLTIFTKTPPSLPSLLTKY
jgi:hypothetical protein